MTIAESLDAMKLIGSKADPTFSDCLGLELLLIRSSRLLEKNTSSAMENFERDDDGD